MWEVRHIRPFCYELYGYNQFRHAKLYGQSNTKSIHNSSFFAKIEWRVKKRLEHNSRNVSFTSIYGWDSH